MSKQAVFEIQINGVKESISAVESLNKQLDALEQRMDKLASKNINVSTSGGDGGARVSALDEEAKMLQQIEQLHQKVAASEKQEYQELLHAKEELKEYQTIAKSIAAQTNLSQNINDTSTMMGMKAQLRDLKMAMQTVDVNGDQFKQWAAEANELTQKLKEAEASYGTFSRNVGNYSNGVVNGLKQIVIKVGETERTFASAREASRTLSNELKSLSVSGKRGTKEWKELNAALIKFNNDVAGTSAGLNRVISALQGFTAVASVGRGLSSLFGIDNNEVNQSIQKLVALQGVLQGLQTIQQQLANNKGLGIVFNNAFGKIDQYNFALKRLIVSIAGTGTAARVAAVGVNLLSGAVKGLMSLGVMALITAAIEGISKLGKKIQEWAKGNADLVSSEKLLQNEIDATNEKLQKEIDLINKRYNAGQINAEQQRLETEKAYADAIEKSNEALQRQLELASKKGGNTSFANAALGNQSWVGDKGVTTFGGFSEGLKTMDDLVKRYELLTKAVEKNKGVTENANSVWGRVSLSASDARDELNHLEQLVAGDLVNSFRKFDITTEDGRKQFIRFVQNIQQNGNELQQSVLFRMGDILNQKNPELANALNGYLGLVQQFVNNFNGETEKLNIMGEVNNVIKSADPTIALKEQNAKWKKYLDEHGKELQISEVAAINKAMDTNNKKIREYGQKKTNAFRTANAKVEKNQEEALQRLNDLEIKLMDDGLMKQLRQLEEENRRVCAQIRKNGVNVGELIKRQEEYYAKERKKIIDEYVAETNQILSDAKIDKIDAQIEEIENKMRELSLSRPLNPTPADNDILSRMFEGLGEDEAELFVKTFNATLDRYSEKSVTALIGFMENLRDNPEYQNKASEFENLIDEKKTKEAVDMALKTFKEYYGERAKLIERYGADFIKIDEQEGAVAYQLTSELSESLKARLDNNRKYYAKDLKDYQEYIDEREKLQNESENTSYNSEFTKLKNERDKLENATDENQIKRRDAIDKQIEALSKQHANNMSKIEQDGDAQIRDEATKFYDTQLATYNDYLTSMSNLADKQPEVYKSGFINVKETRANYEEIKNTANQMIKDVDEDIEKLNDDLKNGLILPETYNAVLRQLTAVGTSANQAFVSAEQGMEGAKEKLKKQIQEIANEVSQTAQQMISYFGDLYNYNIQKEMDALEDMNQKLEDKLNEQKEIEERHKNEIESIEDELANSRGDRRQQLIDQLNAEMQARREAAAEQKRIEAEKEKNEHRLEVLDKKKRMAQWKRDIASALISGAMAAANGYATKPFLPTGLAMGALATILTAAQVAIIRHNKPYAKGGQLDGGVIKGKRHYAGGISVLGGRANVEGGEYITNRISTANNVALLDFVNSKKHKINLSELIDFYQSPKALKSSSKRVFADGGQLPTMPNIDLGDIMTDVAILRDNRPVVVSVVDINRKQDDVRRVRTLAGL